MALGGVNGGGAALDDVGDAVELGGVAAGPEAMEIDSLAGLGATVQSVGNDGEGAAGAGEAGEFAEAAELDGDLAGAGDFVDGMRDRAVGNVGFVGRRRRE